MVALHEELVFLMKQYAAMRAGGGIFASFLAVKMGREGQKCPSLPEGLHTVE